MHIALFLRRIVSFCGMSSYNIFFHYLKSAGFSKITAHKMGWKWQLHRGDVENL
jgi:hypothetical protein